MTNTELKDLEGRLWQSADMLRAGATLQPTSIVSLSLDLSSSVMLMCYLSSIRRRLMQPITSIKAHAWSVAIRT